MTNIRIVNFAYLVFAILVFYVVGELMTQLWAQFQLREYYIIGQYGIPWLVSLLGAVGTLIVLRRHQKVTPFCTEVVEELREVSWPTRQETTSSTMVVVLTVVIVALLMGSFDLIWAKVTKFLLNPSI